MDIKKIQDADVTNKKVLVRVDFNVAVENGKVKEVFKIEAARETIGYLLERGAKVALVSHLGRPEGKVIPELSLGQMKDEVSGILGVRIKFIPDCIGEKVKKGMGSLGEEEVLLLENIRFYEGEENDDPDFARKLADGFDLYVNEAFAVSHRSGASLTGITEILDGYGGFRLQKEISELEKVKDDPEHPAVAIIGGAKIETKIPVINFFENGYDQILVGGKIANEAMDKGMGFSEKVILPVDSVDDRLDIGPETRNKFKSFISQAKTIVWNGPLGKFEDEKYIAGSKEILDAAIGSGAFVLIGGGETLELLERFDCFDKVGFVSTGGGAMLDFLGGNSLPGIEVLRID